MEQVGSKQTQSKPRWQQYAIVIAMLSTTPISGCATGTLGSMAPQSTATHASLPSLPSSALALDELISLARKGYDSGALIARIRDTGAYFRLSASEVISLRERGLPMAVIDYILTAERKFLAGASNPSPAIGQEQEIPAGTRPHRPIPALYQGV
jgi:hypothetical protein